MTDSGPVLRGLPPPTPRPPGSAAPTPSPEIPSRARASGMLRVVESLGDANPASGQTTERSARGPADPAVLLVGADARLHAALAAALGQHGVFVETAPVSRVVDSAVAAAPDLILLVGDAASDSGAQVVGRLSVSPMTSVIPVVILEDRPELTTRLQAFRHGITAVIPRSASVDAIASQVAELAQRIPDRPSISLGQIGEATLREFTEALSHELRTGILSVRGADSSEDAAVRLVLGAGRPLSGLIDEFVARVKEHVVSAELLRYEFEEFATGTMDMVAEARHPTSFPPGAIQGVTVLLADDHAVRADAVAHELRQRGATVVVTDFEPTAGRWMGLRQLNPTVLILGADCVQGRGYELVRNMRDDLRMRWASLLVVDWKEIWPDELAVSNLECLLEPIRALVEADCAIRRQAAEGRGIGLRLETMGPTRLLHALLDAEKNLRLTVHDPPMRVTVDIAPGLLVGATSQNLSDPSDRREGADALAVLLGFSTGRALVEHVVQAETANLMATIDVALHMADPDQPFGRSSAPAWDHAEPPGRRPAGSPRAQLAAVAQRGGAWVQALRSRLDGSYLDASWRRWVIPMVVVTMLGLVGGLVWQWPKAPEPTPQPPNLTAAPTQATPVASQPSAVAQPSSSAEPPDTAAPVSSSAIAVVGEQFTTAPTCEVLLAGEPAQARGLDPDAVIGQLRLARRALVQGNLDAAQRSYCRAARWSPQSVPALVGAARVLLLRRDGLAATQWARKALAIQPDDADLQALLGDALVLSGKDDEARSAWLAATRVDGRDTAGVLKLSRRYRGVGDAALDRRLPQRAERYYRRAIVLNPDDVSATMGLVLSLRRGGDSDNALLWARRAVALGPSNPHPHVLLGDLLYKAGDGVAAEAQWRKAAELDPTDPEARHRLLRLASGD